MTLGRNMGIMDNVDVTVSIIANDNVELACAFIQKKAVEKVSQSSYLFLSLSRAQPKGSRRKSSFLVAWGLNHPPELSSLVAIETIFSFLLVLKWPKKDFDKKIS